MWMDFIHTRQEVYQEVVENAKALSQTISETKKIYKPSRFSLLEMDAGGGGEERKVAEIEATQDRLESEFTSNLWPKMTEFFESKYGENGIKLLNRLAE